MSNFAELASQIDSMDSQPEEKADSFASLANKIDSYQAPKSSSKSSDKGYFAKVAEAASKFQSAVDKGDITTAPKAVAESALGMATGAPIGLLKHGIEEGAYLSGQEPNKAQTTAERVLPIDGYQPKSEAGQALSNLVSTAGQPLVDAGQWAAEKLGFSPSAQKIAGDFSPVVIPKAIAATPGAIRSTVGAVKDATGAVKSAAGDMNARFQELQRIGRGEPPLQPQSPVTPQVIRGQEPVAPEIAAQLPKEAPPLTIENASPELRDILKNAADDPISQEAVKRYLQADALPIKMPMSKGQATGDIQKMADEWNARGKVKEYGELFDKQNPILIDNINAIADRAAPRASGHDHIDNGNALIDAYKSIDDAAKADISAKYKALEEANGGQFPLDGKSFVDAADAALSKKLKTHYVPADVRATLNDLRDGGKMTFEDFETLRSDLADTARSAADGKVRAAANIVRQQLEDMPMPEGAEHLKPLADAARSAAKQRFANLDSDPAYKAAATDSIHADDFVKNYIIKGKKENLAKMQEAVGSDPVAKESIAASAINYLKSKAGIINDRGDFNQRGYNKALEELSPRLNYLFDPVTVQQIQALGDVSNYVMARPKSGLFNHSNTFSAAAKEMAEGTLNAATGGKSGLVINTARNILGGRKQARIAAEELKPGAGVKISDLPK